MRIIKVSLVCAFILLLNSCSKTKKPSEKFIEDVLVTHFENKATIGDLKCKYSDIVIQDSVKFITVTFDADVNFTENYSNVGDAFGPQKKKFEAYSPGQTKYIYGGVIQLYYTSDYWRVATINIK